MKLPTHSYDIRKARAQIEAARTIYRKLMEIMEEVETHMYMIPEKIKRGTGKFEMREVTREEFYFETK